MLAFPGECVNQLGSEVKSIPERSAGWFKTLDVWHRLMLCDIKKVFFLLIWSLELIKPYHKLLHNCHVSSWRPHHPDFEIFYGSRLTQPLTVPRLRTWRSQGSHSSETWTQYVVQPTQCFNQLSSWYGKTFSKSPENSSEADTWFWWNSNFMCRWLGALVGSPLSSVFVHPSAKNCPSMTKINRGQDTHYLSVCTKSEALYNF